MTKFFRDLVTELLQPSNHLTNCCRLHQAVLATVLFAVAQGAPSSYRVWLSSMS
jgi:hypothetical protein